MSLLFQDVAGGLPETEEALHGDKEECADHPGHQDIFVGIGRGLCRFHLVKVCHSIQAMYVRVFTRIKFTTSFRGYAPALPGIRLFDLHQRRVSCEASGRTRLRRGGGSHPFVAACYMLSDLFLANGYIGQGH